MPLRVCKDCTAEGITTARDAPYPGPRCTTHHRLFRKAQKGRQHARHVEATYGISEDQYWELYRAQNGRCAICQRATGASKRLAVDHDHKCCPGPVSCGQCVRGLIDSVCNRTLGHLRDDPVALRRAADYLENPPARRLFGVTS